MLSRKNTRKRRVRHSSQAKLDLIQIWLFIAQDNPSAADQLLREISKKMQMIIQTPRMGRARGDIRRGLRSFLVVKYVIFFTIEDDGITIVRILHSARDIKSIL